MKTNRVHLKHEPYTNLSLDFEIDMLSPVFVNHLGQNSPCWAISGKYTTDIEKNAIISSCTYDSISLRCFIYIKPSLDEDTNFFLKMFEMNMGLSTMCKLQREKDSLYTTTVEFKHIESNSIFNLKYSLYDSLNNCFKYMIAIPPIYTQPLNCTIQTPTFNCVGNIPFHVIVKTNFDVKDCLEIGYKSVDSDYKLLETTIKRCEKKSCDDYEYEISCLFTTKVEHNCVINPLIKVGDKMFETSTQFTYIKYVDKPEIYCTKGMHHINIHVKTEYKRQVNLIYKVRDILENKNVRVIRTTDKNTTVNYLKSKSNYEILVVVNDNFGNRSENYVDEQTTSYIIKDVMCKSSGINYFSYGHALYDIYFTTDMKFKMCEVYAKNLNGEIFIIWEYIEPVCRNNIFYTIKKLTLTLANVNYCLVQSSEITHGTIYCKIDDVEFPLKTAFMFFNDITAPNGDLKMVLRYMNDNEVVLHSINYSNKKPCSIDNVYNIHCIPFHSSQNYKNHKRYKYTIENIEDIPLRFNELLPDTPYQIIYKVTSKYMNKSIVKKGLNFITKINPEYVIVYFRKLGKFSKDVHVSFESLENERIHISLTSTDLPFVERSYHVKRHTLIRVYTNEKKITDFKTDTMNHYMMNFGIETNILSYTFYGFKYAKEYAVDINESTIQKNDSINL